MCCEDGGLIRHDVKQTPAKTLTNPSSSLLSRGQFETGPDRLICYCEGELLFPGGLSQSVLCFFRLADPITKALWLPLKPQHFSTCASVSRAIE
jgi:hypothetical protein